jgi:hypothetical protein
MKKQQERMLRIRAVEREYLVARIALDHLRDRLQTEPRLLAGEGLRPADARDAANRLESRYFLSLFAEFEAALRDVWENAFGQTTTPRTHDLLEGAAARRSMSQDDLDNAHAVRKYRNALVHEGAEDADAIALGPARSHLCTFLKWMPLDW